MLIDLREFAQGLFYRFFFIVLLFQYCFQAYLETTCIYNHIEKFD